MIDIDRKARKLRELIDQYGSLAFAEGEGRRDQDTDEEDSDRVRMEIDSAIRSLIARTPPEGCVLVPEVPSFEMLSAAAKARSEGGASYEVWVAMLAARPEVK